MSYNYSQWVTELANIIVVSTNDVNYNTVLPNIIDDAEQRIYRDLDLLYTRVTDQTATLSSGSRTFTLPTDVGVYLVVEGVNVITPVTQSASQGTRNPLTNTSVEVIDITYPSNNIAQGVPEFFAMKDNATLLVGPPPDAPYAVEIRGTQRPVPLSSANSSTILTQMLPDLFMAASCFFAAGYMKNFGMMSDDPQAGITWEKVYQSRLQSARTEEERKKYRSVAWTNAQPSPAATPPRV